MHAAGCIEMRTEARQSGNSAQNDGEEPARLACRALSQVIALEFLLAFVGRAGAVAIAGRDSALREADARAVQGRPDRKEM